jgi:hypothetical protein
MALFTRSYNSSYCLATVDSHKFNQLVFNYTLQSQNDIHSLGWDLV